MASKLKTQEVILQSPNGLQEATLSLSDSGVVSSNKAVSLPSSTTIAQEAWHYVGTSGEPAFQTSWTNYGLDSLDEYENLSFMKDSMGFVHIRGLIKSGTGESVFVLPVGYRPSKKNIFSIIGNNSIARCDISKTGSVLLIGVWSSVWTSLNGITFKAEQ